MSNGNMLSQDEIDALLKGTDDTDNNEPMSGEVHPPVEDYLSLMEQDALGEIGNISFGSSATALSTLLNQKVDITTPNVSIVHRSNLSNEFPQPYVAIHVSYTVGFSGTNLLVIQQSDATIIADLMLGGNGENPPELLGEIQLSAVQEAMNQMMGSAATSMSTVFSKKIDISPPSIDLLDIKEGEGTEKLPSDDILIKISFRLKIGELIDSSIMQLVPVQFAKELVNELLNQSAGQEVAPAIEYAAPQLIEQGMQTMNQEENTTQTNITQQQTHSYDHHMNQYTPVQQQGPQHLGLNFGGGQSQANVQPAVFSNFEQVHLNEPESKNLNMLLDIPLQVTVELGRTKRSIKEILELSPGSIIELDKLAGEPVDVLVNSKLIAKGEVVVIDENFGVRITDIISQSDRIKKLN
ncbi:flagellar motor switch phosphatase FliY [Fredinandcohnia quinoae]|uniref:Flagellar motor switch phosphatase FliY n=1 Tax=Fredinandcohnia quinoae TaxID=2918902 RepID=A0AAW5DWS7_9BACI|nr:flagellar motor switch phosphatase FliY [Fredinandcohnia sp. SECRCQ15]MCH1623774.1 flagellar motor switch phosphatase FliY [Fredinandcohnia sp. SECRCQ15]